MILDRFSQHIVDSLALMSNVSHQQHYSPSSSTSPSTYVPPHLADNAHLDSGLSPTDNLIENLTNTLALLTQSYKTYLPQTNNQLRTSSNTRNQDTVQDGRVVVQNVQGRQNRGHIARNCTQSKHPQNFKYYKDKMLLMQAQENRVALDVEQLLFLAGSNGMFMANLSSADPVTDEAGPSYDSDILSETHINEFDFVDDQSCSDEDVPDKIFSNPLFEEEIIPMKINQHHFNAESDLIESMLNHDSSIISFSSKIDSLLDDLLHLVGSQPMLKSSYKAKASVIISIPPLVGGMADKFNVEGWSISITFWFSVGLQTPDDLSRSRLGFIEKMGVHG
nr:hypothetical protein [Tanacetum cinerariifolium]